MLKKLLILSTAFLSTAYSGCIYLEPAQTTLTDTFFQEIINQSNHSEETFETLLAFFHVGKESFHRFQFEYPLEDKKHAELFFKVLEIKAQEAHRFVPVFTDCQFLYPKHLGFLRKALIANGPTIWEHTLVDKKSKSVLFIEEQEVLPNGEKIEGCFACLNAVIEKAGQWYFSGIYLYTERPSPEEIAQTEQMFFHTYENMIAFIKNGLTDSVYKQLHKY
jgi:hypothetical protein